MIDCSRLLAILVALDLRRAPVPADQGVNDTLSCDVGTSFDLMSRVFREAMYQ